MIGLERFMRKPGGMHAPLLMWIVTPHQQRSIRENFCNYNPNGLS
jgi:hypothetical protein